ncbi:MAG: hypothetical protein KCHDKBKB_02878 [Elusimicrobia bacterium]|nr:hypothetical protein [Elusimicrobiota bacterium]
MMPKLTFDTKAEWDQAVENVGVDTDDAGCVLSSGATPLVLADDFNDGSRDPLWKGHITNSLIAAFDPPGPSDEPLGVTNLRTKLAQSFTLPIPIQLSEIQLKLEEFVITTISPDLIVEIRDDDSGKPSGNVLASRTLPYASLTPINGWTVFDFPDLPSLPSGQKLWIVFTTNPIGSSGEHINWLYDLSQDLPGQNLMFLNGSTGQWNTQFVPTHDFYFRISRAIDLNPKPTEGGGYLSFEYQNTSGSGEHIHMIRDVAQGDWEMELRFRLRRLAPIFNSGQFVIGILQGTRTVLDGAERTAKLLHEFRFNTQNNFNVSYDARMVDGSGTIHTSGSGTWPNINVQNGFLANDPHIFNLKATRVGNGIKYLLYHSDNPANILLETSVSPTVRDLGGDIFFDIGSTSLFNSSFGVAFDLDYLYLNSPPVELPTGFLRLRHSFGVNTKLENFEFRRQIPAVGDKVELQFRSGNTIAELEAAAFGPIVATQPGSFDPGNPQNLYEKAILNIPMAKFFETKLSLTKASPSPILELYALEFTPEATPAPEPEAAKPILTYRRIIDSNSDWGRAVEKSSSIAVVNGMATLSPVFQDLFDAFVIGSDWTAYQRNANVFSSLGFLRMNILGGDADAILVKTAPIPAAFNATVRWKLEDLAAMQNGATFNVFSVFNGPTLPTPNDIRVGGLGTSTTHHTIIIRRVKGGDGSHRFGIVACRSDGVFVGWNQTTQTWVPGAGDQVIPAGKEATLWTFEVCVVGGVLTIKAKDDQSVIRFDTSVQPLNIKINDNQRWMVLGDSDLSDMPSGTTQLFDSVETDIPTSGASSGFIRFRDSLGARGRLGTIKVIPSTLIQADPAPISIKARSADSVDDLINVSFKDSGQFVPSVFGNEVNLDVPPGAFVEVELSLFSQSPGPEIQFLSWEIEPLIDDTPLILSLDAITPDAVAVSSSVGAAQPENQSTVPNVKDGDPDTQWVSTTGLEGFGISWSLTLGFKKGTVFIEEIIDTIIFRNTNFKKVTITLTELNSNNLETVFSGELLTTDVIITFPPKLTAQIIIAIETSQSPNELKTLGEIFAGRLLVALPNFTRYEPKRELVESGTMRTLGGKIVAFRGCDKYMSRWTVEQVSKDLKDVLEETFKTNALVTFWPEPKFRTRDIFDVAWKLEEIPFPYTDLFKTAGHTIEAEMSEV